MIGQSKTRLLGVAVLIAMFAAGGLTGAVLQRSATADSDSNPARPSPPQQRGPNLFEKLQLTETQHQQVCTIMKRKAAQMRPHEQAFQAAWKEHEPAMKAIISATNAEMDSVLTPEQRAMKDTFREERQKYYRERAERMKQSTKPGEGGPHREGERSGRSGPGNPLGVSCPGLNDSRGSKPWGGDSSGRKKPAGTETMRTPVAPTIEPANSPRDAMA